MIESDFPYDFMSEIMLTCEVLLLLGSIRSILGGLHVSLTPAHKQSHHRVGLLHLARAASTVLGLLGWGWIPRGS